MEKEQLAKLEPRPTLARSQTAAAHSLYLKSHTWLPQRFPDFGLSNQDLTAVLATEQERGA